MDFGAALSSLIKPQPQFPDAATLLALANLKYPVQNFNFPNYVPSMPRQQPSNGMPNFDFASFLAAAAAAAATSDSSPKLSLPSLPTNVSISSEIPHSSTTPTPSTATALSQLPIPIPAQPTSPTQSSASASSISSGGSSSLIQSAQSSPSRTNGSSTPLFSAGYKRKLNGTPTRKPPKPIPNESKDSAYYERRKKNNDAAKRSRDARKMKEEHTAARASFLEQENLQLRTQVEMMKAELAKCQVMLLTQSASDFQQLPSSSSDFSMSLPKENGDSEIKKEQIE